VPHWSIADLFQVKFISLAGTKIVRLILTFKNDVALCLTDSILCSIHTVVVIRMRPLNSKEGNHKRVWKVLPQDSIISETTSSGQPLAERITGRNFFNFDQTFGEEAATGQVYDSICKDIVTSAVTGLNGTIFAYGQTSSGKTYTMQGSGTIEEGSRAGADGTVSHAGGGIVHMAAADIFRHVESQPNRVFLVRASFLEIYNEEVHDLLTKDKKDLKIHEDPELGVVRVQSEEVIVTDFESLLSVLINGEKSRTVASTFMNERSSRSHTIFRITIESRCKPSKRGEENDDPSGSDGAVLVSTLNLVDLAGSEKYTIATKCQQKESAMINQR
jgi:centromeric protein E